MNIDINCDVGEGIQNEHLLMPYITSCNIACGGHFGDVNTINETIALAIDNNVLIGAHPSFPDKKNFGRKAMKLSKNELKESLEFQMNLFLDNLTKFNQKMHHLKPHGALYNLIASDRVVAENFVEIVSKYLVNSYLYVPYGSEIEEVAIKNKIKIKYEAFADRNYTNTLQLVSRAEKNAMILDPKQVYHHIFRMIKYQKVLTISGDEKMIKADTFCIHGDSQNALEILTFLKDEFNKNQIKIG